MKPDIIATVAAITVICYLIGMACKAYGKIDKWIPCIVGAVGAVLDIVGMSTIKDFPANDILNALAIGIASGLSSTGANQIVKQLSQKNDDIADEVKD
jgi:uncharacterized membrane protein